MLSRVGELAGRLRARLDPVTLVLHGSYARVDFNLWSDVDVIIVSPVFEGLRVLDRYDPLLDLLPPGFEAIPMTPRGLRQALEKPAWRQALAKGYIVVADDPKPRTLTEEGRRAPRSLRELGRSLRELLAGTA